MDVKVQNNPEQLFSLMQWVPSQFLLNNVSHHILSTIISAQPAWEAELAPRILIGLWHPKFCAPAQRILPTIRLSHIGMSPHIARKFFWESCDTFSLSFSSLLTPAGERFRKECKTAGKTLMVWTVNRKEEMREASIFRVPCAGF